MDGRSTTITTNISDDVEALEKALKQLLREFVSELKSVPLIPVDKFNDKVLVQRRKDQLSVTKDTMSMIRQMRELIESLKDESARNEKTNLLSNDNVALLEQARSLMKEKKVG